MKTDQTGKKLQGFQKRLNGNPAFQSGSLSLGKREKLRIRYEI